MKVKAKRTLKNSYCEALFREGTEYRVIEEDEKRVFIENELHWETVVRKAKLLNDFDIVEE